MGLLFVNGICYSDSSETNGVIPITWDQYFNLTEEQKMNDTPYYITDAPSGYALASKTRTITTPTSLATFNASAMPMPTLKVSVEAKQDLHGYDKPWVGGAGKNKLKVTASSTTINGVTITVESDGTIKCSNNATTTVDLYISGGIVFPAGSYILNGCPSGGGNSTYKLDVPNASYATDAGNGATFTANGTTQYGVRLVIYSGYGNGLTFKPMIRLATESDPTFEPYSNICPISGWTGANVSDVGKNLYKTTKDGRTNNGVTYVTSGSSITASNSATGTSYAFNNNEWNFNNSLLFKAGTYTISMNQITGSAFAIVKVSENGGADSYIVSYTSNSSATFTLTEDTHIAVNLRITNGSSTDTTFNIQIERGEESSTFEAYNGNTYPISWQSTAGEVYGAEVDVVNGTSGNKLKYGFRQGFTRGALDSSGKLYKLSPILDDVAMWTDTSKASEKIMSNMFEVMSLRDAKTATTPSLSQHETSFYVGGYVGDEATLDALLSDLQVKYELATPTTFTTSPTPIKSLNGQNNLSVDCGEVIEGEYLAPLGTDIAMNNQLYGAGEAVLSEYSNKAETVLQKQLSDTSMHQILLSSDTTSNDGYYEVGKASNLYHQKYGSPGYGISTITLIDPNTTRGNTLHAAELSVDEANDTSLHLFKRANTSSQMEGMTITTTDAILNGSTWDGTNTSLKDAVSKIIIVNVTNFDSTNNIVTLDHTYTEIETLLEDGHIVVIYYDYNNASLIEFRLRLFYHGSLRAMRFEEMPQLTPQSNTLNISFASIRQTLSGSTDTNQFIYDNTTYTIPLNT